MATAPAGTTGTTRRNTELALLGLGGVIVATAYALALANRHPTYNSLAGRADVALRDPQPTKMMFLVFIANLIFARTE